MKNLKYFLFGSAVALLFISVLDKITELILLWIEVFKIKPVERILKHQKDIAVLKEFLKPTPPLYETIYEDNDWYDED